MNKYDIPETPKVFLIHIKSSEITPINMKTQFNKNDLYFSKFHIRDPSICGTIKSSKGFSFTIDLLYKNIYGKFDTGVTTHYCEQKEVVHKYQSLDLQILDIISGPRTLDTEGTTLKIVFGERKHEWLKFYANNDISPLQKQITMAIGWHPNKKLIDHTNILFKRNGALR